MRYGSLSTTQTLAAVFMGLTLVFFYAAIPFLNEDIWVAAGLGLGAALSFTAMLICVAVHVGFFRSR